tara:strand:- start:137 stop:253 length:117 start_codon:yes stop_codon:yes gene_type:complete
MALLKYTIEPSKSEERYLTPPLLKWINGSNGFISIAFE